MRRAANGPTARRAGGLRFLLALWAIVAWLMLALTARVERPAWSQGTAAPGERAAAVQAQGDAAPEVGGERAQGPGGDDARAAVDGPTAQTAVALDAAGQGPALRWIAAGGGADPASTQLSLQLDLEAVGATFEGPGSTLFAAGRGAQVVAVQELEAFGAGSDMGDALDLRSELAALLAWNHTRGLRFAEVTLDAAPATAAGLTALLQRALPPRDAASAADPLLLLFAGHGAPHDRRDGVALSGWDGDLATPAGLAAVLDELPQRRPLISVVAACHGGAFAETAFIGAAPERGLALPPRCGLFAAPWDLPSSGCDPHPDRRQHDGYLRIFLAALRRLTPAGAPIPKAAIDFDGDGQISLLEAHSRVAIASAAIDVPTTTAQRWLRARSTEVTAVAAEEGLEPLLDLPVALSPSDAELAAFGGDGRGVPAWPPAVAFVAEELAIVRALAAELRLTQPMHQAGDAYAERDGLVQAARDAVDDAIAATEAARRAAAAALLARWPALCDPWREAIAAFLAGDPRVAAFHAALHARSAAERLESRALLARALAERLQRAVLTVRLAVRAAAEDGETWRGFVALRLCERAVPALRPGGGASTSPSPSP